MKNRTQILIRTAALLIGGTAFAGTLHEARLDRLVNDVKVVDPARGAHPATLQEVIKADLGVRTGVKSRAELRFQDDTLSRLGPETFFSFTPGTREMSLDQGTMLLQVPKGLGGARIHAAAVTASITGTTILFEYIPHKHLKVLVLEGSLRISLNRHAGEAMLLTPGKLLIMPPEAKNIPEPVDVNLRHVTETSTLVNSKLFAGSTKSAPPRLPSMGLIQTEIDRQQAVEARGGLAATSLAIQGRGTALSVLSQQQLAALDIRSRPSLSVSAGTSQNSSGRKPGNSNAVIAAPIVSTTSIASSGAGLGSGNNPHSGIGNNSGGGGNLGAGSTSGGGNTSGSGNNSGGGGNNQGDGNNSGGWHNPNNEGNEGNGNHGENGGHGGHGNNEGNGKGNRHNDG